MVVEQKSLELLKRQQRDHRVIDLQMDKYSAQDIAQELWITINRSLNSPVGEELMVMSVRQLVYLSQNYDTKYETDVHQGRRR